jgi:predicted ATPase with chaperone activity
MYVGCEAVDQAASIRRSHQEMVKSGDTYVPKFPTQLEDLGIDPEVLSGLVLKHAYAVPKFSTEWMIRKMCLPLPVVTQLLENLRADHMLEVRGHSGPFGYNYACTHRGLEQAKRMLEISGYLGPTPVSLEAYISALEFQFVHLPQVCPDDIESAVSELVLSEQARHVGGLAIMSRRSLFMYGPPGNGKTTLGHLLHRAVRGNVWIPYAICVENEVIRLFDAECHQQAGDELSQEMAMRFDARWVNIERPFIVVGGELTMESLDLIYDTNRGYYEAPLHFKANGGTFLLDDFGCQRVAPQDLLNRWIHPLERGLDFLTLRTGQQLEVPFRQLLMVSTNLDPDRIMSPAFLRRMGYRLHMPNPSREDYATIFRRYASDADATVPDGLLAELFNRYESEQRPLRSCEPRDLIERVRDICQYRGLAIDLTSEMLNTAWDAYFGDSNGAAQKVPVNEQSNEHFSVVAAE